MINYQLADREKQIELLTKAIKKMHINMMASKLEELGEKPAIHPDYAPAKMEDGQYLFFISKVFFKDRESKQGTVDKIKEFCDEKKNIDGIFNIEQAKKLKEISPKIKHGEIKNFFEKELIRLGQSVPAGEVGIRRDSLAFQEDPAQKEKLMQKNKVDLLIGIHDSGKEIQLNQERFCMLIKEYISEAYNLKQMQKTSPDLFSKEERDKKERERDKYNGKLIKIGDLIDRNKLSLNFLGTQKIEDNEELRMNVPRFMYLTCNKGDLKSLNTLIENLGERNLLAVFLSIPLKKESNKDFDGLITLNGMISIIKQRADDTGRKDSAEWKELLDLFEKTVVKREEINEGLSGLSLAGQDDGGPAARSTRPRDQAEKVVGNSEQHEDGGPAKR